MIVIIAGMPRSGSTYTFNVVRELLLLDGDRETSWVTTNDFSGSMRDSSGKHLIIKSHHPDEIMRKLISLNAAYFICSIRKPEDAVVSWMRTFNATLDESIDVLKDWFLMYKELSLSKICTIDY